MVEGVSGWRRFERASHDGSGRFWAIRVSGRACEIRFGPIGAAEASEEQVEHASEAEAARAARQKIRTKQRAGWVEVEQVDDARSEALAHGEQFERAIAADPSNLDNWAVYADWLQAIEPPLGERVALGLALARAGSKAARMQIEARCDELERKLLGPTLAGLMGERKFDGVIELERQFGMIVQAKLWDPENEILKFDTLVAALLDSPLARVLLDLRVDIGLRRRSLARVVELFVACQRPHLRRLCLGVERNHGGAVDMELPGITKVLERAPMLERLELHGAFYGDAKHERLRELKLHRPVNALAVSLPSWRLPALHTLHLIEPGAVDWHLVELPKLRQLLVEWPDCGDRLVARLARAPLLERLESLMLTQTALTADGVHTLLDATSFAKVGRLVLLDVDIDRDDIARLHRRFPNLVVQARPDREDDWLAREYPSWREWITRF